MKKMFIKDRICNMTAEFIRLSKFMFSPSHLRIGYRMLGDYKVIRMTNDRLLPPQGEDISGHGAHYQPVDAFDRVLDVVMDTFKVYWRNVVVQNNCSHPHDRVYEEWEGDREYGYYRQMYCAKCLGYLSEEHIDRYSVERNQDGYHKMARPKADWEYQEDDDAYDPYDNDYDYYYEY